jgi:hypothetical protein
VLTLFLVSILLLGTRCGHCLLDAQCVIIFLGTTWAQFFRYTVGLRISGTQWASFLGTQWVSFQVLSGSVFQVLSGSVFRYSVGQFFRYSVGQFSGTQWVSFQVLSGCQFLGTLLLLLLLRILCVFLIIGSAETVVTSLLQTAPHRNWASGVFFQRRRKHSTKL